MKVAISTDNNLVSPHFGRCPHFTIVEIAGGEVQDKTTIENPKHISGCLSEFLADNGVKCVIAGGMGVRAQSAFVQFGIETIVGVTGKVDNVIQKILDGTLQGGESLCDWTLG